MATRDTADELRRNIANYKQTRRAAARSMHRWLDTLIADTERELRERVDSGDGRSPTAPLPPSPPAPHAASFELRSTYPLDERAPRQRTNL